MNIRNIRCNLRVQVFVEFKNILETTLDDAREVALT